MHAFSFDLRPSRRASSLTAGEMKDNLVEEIKEIYKRVNPDKKDVPELLAYYEGQELDLYKKICAKYNLEPKDRFGSILSRRRRRHRSGSSQEKGPSMPSRPGPADLRRNAAEADGLSGAEPKAVAADVADVSADAAETAVPMPPEPVPPEPEVPKGSARPQSPPLPPRNPGVIPAFRPVTRPTGRYWPCPPPPHKFVPPTPKVVPNLPAASRIVPPPPRPTTVPQAWWPPAPPPPKVKNAPGTTPLPARPAKKEMPKGPQARIIHAFHACHASKSCTSDVIQSCMIPTTCMNRNPLSRLLDGFGAYNVCMHVKYKNYIIYIYI